MKHSAARLRQSAPLLIPRVSLSRDRYRANCVSRSIDTDAPATTETFGTRNGLDRQRRRSGAGFLFFILAILVLLSLSNCSVASASVNVWTSNGPEGGPPS